MTALPPDQAVVPQPLRLMLDSDGERLQARVRTGAAWIALAAGIWLVSVDNGWWLRLTALASVAFALRWLSLQRVVRATLADARSHYLEIDHDQLLIAEGATRRSVPRANIVAIELDNDRLVVIVRLRDGEELAIEPRYGNLGPHELGQTLQRALFAQS